MTNSIPFEHERRFVPDAKVLPFDYKKYPMKSILQGYLKDAAGTRLRDESDEDAHTYLQTRKTGSGVSRTEDEHEITKEEFDTMWHDVECSLSKSRYFITWDDIDIEFNVFHGALDGYMQIEVEFDSHDAAVTFTPPSWLGREVTDDKSHGNYALAKHGIPK
ncbi:MAG: hypothetical protein M0P64_00520 [Candidatus Pacebacteria bacterium]|jgi:CYTH domain-containing protein|nr:hypothetical protein [Candidatus Paceibacterota bacterium]